MAQRHATPLADFPRFLGSPNEVPDGHMQLFEVICGAHEILDDGRKLCIFPATLRGEASEWYANPVVQERATYNCLKTNFLRKFRGPGFEEKLAEQFDHLRQGASESIDKKLGNSVPDNETLKRRFLVGLHDGKVEEYIRLKRPVSLEEAKREARIWEEVQGVLRLHTARFNLASQCKVQQLECELEKLRDVVSHLESELAQERTNRIQQAEKMKEIERVAYEWFKDTQDIKDKKNKKIDQLVKENEGFQELIKRWEIDRKIQREKIVSEMEKREKIERKIEALMRRTQTLEKTKIGKIALKGKEGRLGSRHIEIEGCRTKKEVETREKVSGDRVEVSQKEKGNGIEMRKKITKKTETSEVSKAASATKRILEKSETRDFGKGCKGTIGECKEKKKGSWRILAKEIDYSERKCAKQDDKELGEGDALTMDQEVTRKDTFSK
ncbi:hypothetical protein KP509_17G000900 [Ceratopteris richardii]|uniref:Retrotransposon gag domain-containing protein n=1 Tax=Ceratopteris richardii TaxID=49495 RepID=A0A8T2SS98_CERRI|nr:hypothetical protein KP509_17G000900 [Ceratopteris richardii]